MAVDGPLDPNVAKLWWDMLVATSRADILERNLQMTSQTDILEEEHVERVIFSRHVVTRFLAVLESIGLKACPDFAGHDDPTRHFLWKMAKKTYTKFRIDHGEYEGLPQSIARYERTLLQELSVRQAVSSNASQPYLSGHPEDEELERDVWKAVVNETGYMYGIPVANGITGYMSDIEHLLSSRR
ncbi:hypothetical protein BDV96DRAFT_641972 [Lophiotrema nucula]|uniref:Uncharacterized protein n=1 Tax=Lophiotrema nucula TaxID=690887 RepID=A0A6A5ZL76_9PLEO|nr:hypothetical protein BDV96DRAFT_641972 [Lophiotrema nucula]